MDTTAEIIHLRAQLAEREAELMAANLLIEQHKAQLHKLRRMQFERSSEVLDAQIEQLELRLEDLEEAEAARVAAIPRPRPARSPAVRKPLPTHLPCEDVLYPAVDVCPSCGGTHLVKLGENITEVLEKVPARLKVIRHVRPKFSCRACETITQAPYPDLPIEKDRPGPGLLAHVMVSKYPDGLPLYRQSAILAREGVEIERATLADWVGHTAWWLAPLATMIGAHVRTAPVIHTDDTPVPLLSPGLGRTRTGRLWVYLADERSWQRPHAPAAWYRFSPDRKGERPRDHLTGFEGTIQADAYNGYGALTRESGAPGRNTPRIQHAACWAHARRKLFEEFERTKSPIAQEALRRIGELYAIEVQISGETTERRALARQEQAHPLLAELKRYLQEQRRRLSAKTNLAKAINYALGRWENLSLYTTDGRIDIDNNPRRTRLARHRHHPQKLSIPRLRGRRRSRRHHLHRTGNRQAQPRPASRHKPPVRSDEHP